MTFLEVQNEQKNQIEELRSLAIDWLAHYKVTQAQLAKNIGATPSCLHDFLTGRRGLSNDNFLRLGAVVSRPASPHRNVRFVHPQNLGVMSAEGLDVDIEDARKEFEAQRAKVIFDANERRKEFQS